MERNCPAILVLRVNDCLCSRSRRREKAAVSAACIAQRLVRHTTLEKRRKASITSTMRCQPDVHSVTFKEYSFPVNDSSLPGAERDFRYPLLPGVRAKNHLQLPLPVLSQGDQLPLGSAGATGCPPSAAIHNRARLRRAYSDYRIGHCPLQHLPAHVAGQSYAPGPSRSASRPPSSR